MFLLNLSVRLAISWRLTLNVVAIGCHKVHVTNSLDCTAVYVHGPTLTYVQYTPPTPTRRNCRVASCRRCKHTRPQS